MRKLGVLFLILAALGVGSWFAGYLDFEAGHNSVQAVWHADKVGTDVQNLREAFQSLIRR